MPKVLPSISIERASLFLGGQYPYCLLFFFAHMPIFNANLVNVSKFTFNLPVLPRWTQITHTTVKTRVNCYWGIDPIRKHPQVITILMGGVYTIPSHGRFMAARVFPHSWRTSTTLRWCQESETMQGDRRVLEPKPRRGCAVGAVLPVFLGSAGHLSNN